MRRAARAAPVPVLFIRTAALAAATGVAFAGLPTAAQKKTFRETKAWTVSIEVTSRAGKAFDPEPSPKTTMDKARFFRKTVAFAITLDRSVAREDLIKLMRLSAEEAAQDGRFVGWEAVVPTAPAGRRESRSSAHEPKKDPVMAPVRYAVEAVEQRRYRRDAEDPWRTDTETALGQGVAWIEKSALLLCDLTRVACEIRLPGKFVDGDDVLTFTSGDDSSGGMPRVDTQGPAYALTILTRDPFASLTRFEIDLPPPIVKEFSWSPRGVDPLEESTILKVTIAPAKIAADAKRSN